MSMCVHVCVRVDEGAYMIVYPQLYVFVCMWGGECMCESVYLCEWVHV